MGKGNHVRLRAGARQVAIALIAPISIMYVAGCSSSAASASPQLMASPARTVTAPPVILWRWDNMANAKAQLAAGNATLRPAYDALIHDATIALSVGPFSVMDKRRTPPSGDKHDYMSLAPYWWPDSTKPGGVPFIRRDGDVNPESRLDTDSPRFSQMSDAVETLALAYYFSDDARFGERAARLMRTWFLDPATRMNPNLRFAQAIPGVTEGRGIGIIDTRNLSTITDAVVILRGSPYWSSTDDAGMIDWCRRYAAWLQTSPQGIEEAKAANNHGTWYDAQLASLALFVGDSALARRVIAAAGPGRIAPQIAADGKQPEELSRTRPLHYSLFNLEPFNRLAELGRHVGVDLWNYRGPNGGGLHEAMRFVAPYFNPSVAFPIKEITPADPDEFLKTIRQAAQAYHDASLDSAIAKMPAKRLREDRSALLYPTTVGRIASTDVVPLDSLIARTLSVASSKLKKTATSLDPRNGFPRFSSADGSWQLTSATSWTSGFFPGSLWLMYALTKDTSWRTQAERWTAPLEVNKSRTNTHDLGFLIFDSFGFGCRLTGNVHDCDVVRDASKSLATRFNPTVGAIRSWDTDTVTDGRAGWKYPVIIDNMMNLEMLFWAAKHGGDPKWAEIGERHALTSAQAHVRADGSTAHVALFDPATGKLIRRATWQGYSDSSVWARGQAWAIYGFTRAYEETGRKELLAAAKGAADWYLAHMPSDGIPYWDFRDPAIPNTERDASAGAIAASGLLRLARVEGGSGSKYRTAADVILASLCDDYVSKDPRIMSLTVHSVGGKPQRSEVDVGLVYADYYLLDAIAERSGVRLEGRR